ncbi:class I SAM-dependent methyltransferase [Streptomyces sp. TRM 70351]|uniref:class I SAM-dependent DNA methyltransferase n=1 Tax=Streptomyces sp. TRM 70351 TaxID=3116552 RepID=UPI002E7C2468|nr:class I SAM-dependent methyltransferase [Streptomyces sp. TRM 70351]MEE1930537.1 class I SAM-dependent methyltransferase [Streptomyces sp. TRM 70351]
MSARLHVNRATFAHRLHYALRHPGRVPPHLRRLARDWRLRRLTGQDHVAYYRAVMRDDTLRDPEAAVGSATHERWLALGRMQYAYLLRHGLAPQDRMLEIGCGNLRAGHLFIGHLEPGHYHGVDISPEILLAAQRTLVRHGLQSRLPNLSLVADLRLAHLPDAFFTVVHAHSVFSHSPLEVVDECLAHVGRVLAPGGFFDFTYNRTLGSEHHVLREDFYYRTATLVRLAAGHGLRAEAMEDWDELPHRQSKIRVTADR